MIWQVHQVMNLTVKRYQLIKKSWSSEIDMENRKIPYFIKIEGCDNCEVHKAYITDTGTYYEEGHSLHAKCVHMGCEKYGYNIDEPFITPKEYIRIGAELASKTALNKAKKLIVKFYDYYDSRSDLLPWVLERATKEKDEKSAHVRITPPIHG